MYKFFKRLKISPYIVIALILLLFIFLGSLLLSLPIAYQNKSDFNYINALFISFSAISVTGLSPFVNSLSQTFTTYGIVVITTLVQLGGLGFIAIITFFMTFFHDHLNISDRYLIKESLGLKGFKKMDHFIRSMIIITLVVELIGACLFMFYFVPKFGFLNGLGHSIFHSINSFTNAGFSLSASGTLIEYGSSFYLTFNTALLVVIGGLGFLVIADVLKFRRLNRLKVHSKVVLSTSAFLLIFGALAIFVLNLFSGTKINVLQAFFLSATSRTGGFSTVDFNELSSSSRLIYTILMFVGASPLSTGGGIKTTTIFVIFLTLISFLLGKKPRAFNRSFSNKQFVQSTAIIFISLFIVLVGYGLLDSFEASNPYLKDVANRNEILFFETVSAFSTTGASMGVTSSLSIGSKLVLSILMFFGRIGPITIMIIFSESMNKEEKLNYRLVESDILLG